MGRCPSVHCSSINWSICSSTCSWQQSIFLSLQTLILIFHHINYFRLDLGPKISAYRLSLLSRLVVLIVPWSLISFRKIDYWWSSSEFHIYFLSFGIKWWKGYTPRIIPQINHEHAYVYVGADHQRSCVQCMHESSICTCVWNFITLSSLVSTQ